MVCRKGEVNFCFKLSILVIFSILTSCQGNSNVTGKRGSSREVSFSSSDNVQIVGDLYENSKETPTILLFHQSGSNSRAEYRTIIPKLIEKGYNILAIDQRQGGQLYGSFNRTIANITTNEFGYCDAYADIEGALDYLMKSGFSGSKVLWGSSYSASLAIKLANDRPDEVNAVLAFSPASGGPMKECRPDEYFETLQVPLLLLRPGKEMEIKSVKNQFDLAQQNKHQVYVAENGVHGSSMLVAERVNADVDENWSIVYAFIENYVEK